MSGKLRALLVDDERLARVALAALLRERDDVELVGEASSVATAEEAVRALDPDVVFLDVRMRDGTGFDLLRRVSLRAHVVFTTAFEAHAVDAFAVDALDYLVKPVQRTHLARALERLIDRKTPDEPGTLRLQQGHEAFFARPGDITFLRAARDYTEVHLAGGRSLLVKEPLGSWDARLPGTFARIHRSLIVNLEHLEALTRRQGGWEVRLRDIVEALPVSRRHAASLRRRLG
ncbi:MAG: LytTR family DNA-binding domain-containing protein [Myxococcota bacterium]